MDSLTWMALRLYLDWRGWFRPDVPASHSRAEFSRRIAVTREALLEKFPQVTFEDCDLAGIRAELINASGEPEAPVLFYIHGGAFRVGSIADYRSFALRFSYRLKLRVITFDYRLAPEHPFPAAYDDTCSAYRAFLERFGKSPVYIGGDSAGGNLGLALLCNAGLPPPRAAFFLSPPTDLTCESRSLRENRFRDAAIRPRHYQGFIESYAAGQDLRDPRLSPLFADLGRLPPTLLLAGGAEILRDDSTRFAERARAAGSPVEARVFPRMQHAWPLMFPALDTSKQAMQAIAGLL